MNAVEQAMKYAFDKANSLIKKDAFLPEYVFELNWRCFYFFSSDRMFEAPFVDLVKKLLTAESASTCCVINISVLEAKANGAREFVAIGHETSPQQYLTTLKEGGPASGWLYGVDTFLASSEKGEWCVYCERENDVGVLALNVIDVDCQNLIVDVLQAIPSNQLYENVVDQSFPFNRLTASWREKLSTNYRER